MAELVAGGSTRFRIKLDGSLVGRRSADGGAPPDVDLADLENGRTVSRHHARIFRENGHWCLRVEDVATNDTVVADRTLVPGEQVDLSDGDAIRLGKVALVFQAGADAPLANPDATMVGAVDAPAYLEAGDRTFPLNAPEGRSLSLGRHSEDRSYRPDVDLGDLPRGRTVSRSHAQLFSRGGAWIMRVESKTTNSTQSNSAQLAFAEEIPLADGDQLQFGDVVATFHQPAPIVSAGERIELILDPPLLSVEPGGEAAVSVTVINHTGYIDYFNIEIDGLPKAWCKIILPNGQVSDPALVHLFNAPLHGTPSADATAKLRIVVAPPRECQSAAGVRRFSVIATPQGEPGIRRVVPGQITISQFEELRFELEPKQIRGSHGSYKVTLQNLGNASTTMVLSAEGAGLVSKWPRPEITQGYSLGNCAKDQLDVPTRVRHRDWLGMDRTYVLVVNVTAGKLRETQNAELICPPRIPWWIQSLQQRIWGLISPVWAIVLPLIILAGAYLLFLQPPKITAAAVPSEIVVGQPVKVTWKLSKPGPVSIEGTNGEKYGPFAEGMTDQAVTPQVPFTSYTVTVCNQIIPLPFLCRHQDVKITVSAAPPPAQIASFIADPSSLPKEGMPVKLSWHIQNAITVTLTSTDPKEKLPSPIPRDESGSTTVNPSIPVTYTLVVQGADASPHQWPLPVAINKPQITTLSHAPDPVLVGSPVHLKWDAQGFTTLTLEAKSDDTGQPIEVVSGQLKVPLTADVSQFDAMPTTPGVVDYVLTAANAAGPVSKTEKVTITPFQIDFTAEPAAITAGQSVTLKWNATGAKSIQIAPIGQVSPTGSPLTDSPTKTTSYVFTATGPDGKASSPITRVVTVSLGAPTGTFGPQQTIAQGQSATLSYSVQNAKHIVIQASDGSFSRSVDPATPTTSGTITVSPKNPGVVSYTMTVTNDTGQTFTQSIPVTIAAPTPTPMPTPTPPPPTPAPPKKP